MVKIYGTLRSEKLWKIRKDCHCWGGTKSERVFFKERARERARASKKRSQKRRNEIVNKFTANSCFCQTDLKYFVCPAPSPWCGLGELYLSLSIFFSLSPTWQQHTWMVLSIWQVHLWNFTFAYTGAGKAARVYPPFICGQTVPPSNLVHALLKWSLFALSLPESGRVWMRMVPWEKFGGFDNGYGQVWCSAIGRAPFDWFRLLQDQVQECRKMTNKTKNFTCNVVIFERIK